MSLIFGNSLSPDRSKCHQRLNGFWLREMTILRFLPSNGGPDLATLGGDKLVTPISILEVKMKKITLGIVVNLSLIGMLGALILALKFNQPTIFAAYLFVWLIILIYWLGLILR